MEEMGHIAVYKANKKGTGSAAQFKMAGNKSCMFLEIAKQMDEKTFDWSNKIVVKLSDTDISKFLCLFADTWPGSSPTKPYLELYHQTPKSNKIVSLAKQTNPKYPGYYLSVSLADDVRKEKISIPISMDEAEYLKAGMTRALQTILKW